MEELIQESQQTGQHFPPESMLCGTFKSAKDDGLDEIVIITSLTIHNKTLGRGTHILLWLFGGEISKNSSCAGFKVQSVEVRTLNKANYHLLPSMLIFPREKQLIDRGSRKKFHWLNLVKLTWNTSDNFKML